MMSLHGSQNPQGSSHSIWTESSLSPPLPCRLLAEQIHGPPKGRTGPRSPPWKVCGHVLLPLQVPVLALTLPWSRVINHRPPIHLRTECPAPPYGSVLSKHVGWRPHVTDQASGSVHWAVGLV